MSKNANKRLQLLDKIMTDENEIQVKEVAELFGAILKGQIEVSNTFKKVKSKVTEDEWNMFIHALVNSFLSSLYCSASKDTDELKARMDEVEDANSDVLIKKEERKYDA